LIGQIAGKSGLTDSLFIATKVRARGREAGIAQIEQSLGRFHRRKIDLMQVHNLVDVETQMSALRESKSKGRSGIPELLTQSRRALPKSRET
jgi:Predicted oxidoreductases (related to aryl-alcohol dehydrogenases)